MKTARSFSGCFCRYVPTSSEPSRRAYEDAKHLVDIWLLPRGSISRCLAACAWQRCKLDVPLLAAGLLTVRRQFVDSHKMRSAQTHFCAWAIMKKFIYLCF
ncbi:hypothetical protein D5281_17620 [bacterium 1xD42-62]|uniref:Uncharacterized protein n=1 Tax=Parablautia muri TaxID=2320879 RepID=A0A9X5BHU0_9FIRM|nr:hypothetical protein [Parablautia muri]